MSIVSSEPPDLGGIVTRWIEVVEGLIEAHRAKGSRPGEVSQSLLDAVGTTRSSVSRWKRGLHMPRPEEIAKVCVAARVSAHWLVTGHLPKEAPGVAESPYGQGRVDGRREAWSEVRRVADAHLAPPSETLEVADEALHQAREEGAGKPRRRKRGSR